MNFFLFHLTDNIDNSKAKFQIANLKFKFQFVKMSDKLREEHCQIILTISLFLMVLPFFVFCFFNHPCPEDMSWTENTHRGGFIKSQISLPEALPQFRVAPASTVTLP